MGDEHAAQAPGYGVIFTAKIGVGRQVFIIIEVQDIGGIVVEDIGQGRPRKFCHEQHLQPLIAGKAYGNSLSLYIVNLR